MALDTNKTGNVVIDLHTEESRAECINFINLCRVKYYTFAPLYNLKRDTLVEFGNPLYPLERDGRTIWNVMSSSNPRELSIETNRRKHPHKKGNVSFVTNRKGTGEVISSKVSITLGDIDRTKGELPGVVFGDVVEGFDALDKINAAIVDPGYRPLQDIRIHRIYILADPFEILDGLPVPGTPEPTQAQLSTVRLDDIEQIRLDYEQEITAEELKLKRQRDADSKALTLEIIGDLPSAEAKPLENILFVCKLNRMTRDEDLEIIFSRFGPIKSCEIIKDPITKESLQYAFIEFEEKKSCEVAYFKMDQALIDDRRIHVDFSQSVSKMADAWRMSEMSRKSNGSSSRDSRRSQRPAPGPKRKWDY